MGVVFMAEQELPIRRKVALKIIKPGMDSHQDLARFEAERQAPAMMDHQNIARVLDAGTTDSGRPTSSWNWCMACRSPSSATIAS
jgi:eukaryotic-like serine/threonine-protein kinase